MTDMLLQLAPTFVAAGALFVTFVTVNRQVRAATVTTYRLKWLESLQDDVVTLVGLLRKIAIIVQPSSIDFGALHQAMGKSDELTNRMRLLLNPHDKNHATLNAAIEQARLTSVNFKSTGDKASVKELNENIEAVLVAAHGVLNLEWQTITIGK